MERRRQFRKSIHREGKVEIPGVMLVGTILDESSAGMFFRPEAGVFLGTFTQLDSLPEQMPTHSMVRMSARKTPELDEWTSYDATVQWRGYNDTHACSGMGLAMTRKTSSQNDACTGAST
jgi:hypothetical protein